MLDRDPIRPPETDLEPERRRQPDKPDLGIFAIIGAMLVLLGIIALASLVWVGPVR